MCQKMESVCHKHKKCFKVMSRFQCFHVSIYDPCMTFKFSILVHYDHDLAQINRKLTISFGVALYKIKVDQFDHWF